MFANHFSAKVCEVGSRRLMNAFAFERWLPQKGVVPNDEYDESDDAQTQRNKKAFEKPLHLVSFSRLYRQIAARALTEILLFRQIHRWV
jgi:hypothetical protein